MHFQLCAHNQQMPARRLEMAVQDDPSTPEGQVDWFRPLFLIMNHRQALHQREAEERPPRMGEHQRSFPAASLGLEPAS